MDSLFLGLVFNCLPLCQKTLWGPLRGNCLQQPNHYHKQKPGKSHRELWDLDPWVVMLGLRVSSPGFEHCVAQSSVCSFGREAVACINTSATAEAVTHGREAATGHGVCKSRLKRLGSCTGINLNGSALVSLLLQSPALQVSPSVSLRHILFHTLPPLVIFQVWEDKLARVCGTR